MNVEIVGRHVTVDQALKEFTESRLAKLQRLVGPLDAHVVLEAEKRRARAEIQVHSRYSTLTGAEEAGNLRASISAVMEKLERQARRMKTKVQNHKHRRGPRNLEAAEQIAAAAREDVVAASAAAPEVEVAHLDGTPHRIFTQRRELPLLTVEQAAAKLLQSRMMALIFRDAGSDDVQVMVRRKDGDFDLVAPAG